MRFIPRHLKKVGDFNTQFVASNATECIPLSGIHVTSVCEPKIDSSSDFQSVKIPLVDVVHDDMVPEKDFVNDGNSDSSRDLPCILTFKSVLRLQLHIFCCSWKIYYIGLNFDTCNQRMLRKLGCNICNSHMFQKILQAWFYNEGCRKWCFKWSVIVIVAIYLDAAGHQLELELATVWSNCEKTTYLWRSTQQLDFDYN